VREAPPAGVQHLPVRRADFDERDWTVHTGGKDIAAVGEKASTT
jgi:hypothetical protein